MRTIVLNFVNPVALVLLGDSLAQKSR